MGRDTAPIRDQEPTQPAAPAASAAEPTPSADADDAAAAVPLGESQPLLEREPAAMHPFLAFVRSFRAAATGGRAGVSGAPPIAAAAAASTAAAGSNDGHAPVDVPGATKGHVHRGDVAAAGAYRDDDVHGKGCTASSSGSSSASSSACSSPRKPAEPTICRICLEEDALERLEQPCGCTGTQRHAHHSCIQKWVNEKGNTECEICHQQYKGQYSVPPPRPEPSPLPAAPIGSLYLAIREDDSRDGHLLDAYDDWEDARHPTASWCFSFLLLILFITVLRHMVPQPNPNTDPSRTHGMLPGPSSTSAYAGGSSGAFAGGSSGAYADGGRSGAFSPHHGGNGSSSIGVSASASYDFAAGLSLFLIWMLIKAFLVAIPLYTVMRIAVRQSQQEAMDEMYRFAEQPAAPWPAAAAGPARAAAAAAAAAGGPGGQQAAGSGARGRERQAWLAMQLVRSSSSSRPSGGAAGAAASAGQPPSPQRLVGVV